MDDADWKKGKIHATLDGNKVRSKSEVIIYNILLSLQIPFEYEPTIEGGDGSVRCPDFVFEAQDGTELVLEHYGMMSDSEYRDRNAAKEQWYALNGYEKGISYFSTYDDQDGGLNSAYVSQLCKFISDKVYGRIPSDTPFADAEESSDPELTMLREREDALAAELRELDKARRVQADKERARSNVERLEKELEVVQKIHREAAQQGLPVDEYARVMAVSHRETMKGVKEEVRLCKSNIGLLNWDETQKKPYRQRLTELEAQLDAMELELRVVRDRF